MAKRTQTRVKSEEKPAARAKTRPENTKPAEGEERRGRRRSSRLAFVLVAAVAVAFLIYSLITLIGIRSQLNDRRQELNGIKEQITVQEIKNDEANRTYTLSDEERSDYIEQIARDELDYVREGERIFVNIAGD